MIRRDQRSGAPWLGLALMLAVAGVGRAEVLDGVGLQVEPSRIELNGGRDRVQLVISADGDGGQVDLTHVARFTVEPTGLVEIDDRGVARPVGNGDGLVRIEARGQSAEVPVRVEEAERVTATSYRHEVSAVLSKAGCNMGACHGGLSGKGGFRLSLRGEDPGFDLDMITRDQFGRRISRHNGATSLLVAKPIGLLAHEGGVRFEKSSVEARLLSDWIQNGAQDDLSVTPRLEQITVWPSSRILAAPGLSQQLRVVATFEDGGRRDVTHLATFDVDDPALVDVRDGGLVVRRRSGESVIGVRYLNGKAVSRLAFLADRPGFAWNGPEPRTEFDRAVFEKLRALRIQASPPASDEVFLRRVYLDVVGTLPTAEEVEAYLSDHEPERKRRLVRWLMDRPEYADFWALKWADLLRNEEKTMGTKGVWAMHRWLRDQIAADEPMTRFATELLTGSGSTWENPAASFYRTNRDPETCTESFAQVFLGVRLQCARCHNHPFDAWTQNDYYGLAAFFSNLDRKQMNNQRRDDLDQHEINGDELVFVKGRKPGIQQPRTRERLQPSVPGEGAVDLGPGPDARDELATWLTEESPQFGRNLANRVWFHLMGRGVVEPVDDFRATNPPSNPELLDELARVLETNGFRLKPLIEEIVVSEVYGLDSRPDPTNEDDEANFARAIVKPLPAEVLLDAIALASGHSPDFRGGPESGRATGLAGVRMGGDFLRIFGKPERLLACECERSESTTLAQAFQLINGDLIREAVEARGNRLDALMAQGLDDSEILDRLYLSALTRRATDAERQAVLVHVELSEDRRSAWEDVLWAILNSKEFLLRH